MKKLCIVLLTLILLTSLASCNNNANKKIVPQQQLKVEDKNNTIEDHPVKIPEKTQVVEEATQVQANQNLNNITDPIQIPSTISNEKIITWMPGVNNEHKVPTLNKKLLLLNSYGGYFVGDTSSKLIYLTFDEGYEYKGGFTSRILDILKSNDVRATFFVTKTYIKSNPDLVKRIVQEGHLVGNHTNSHPHMPDISTEKVIKELSDTADYFKEITGKDMPKFFRPPYGEYSERTLYITNKMGYKTILWSMAHKDWDVDAQPPSGDTYRFVDTRYHNGAILLLHPQSKTNTDDLDSVIKNLKSKGYRFALLTELK